MRKIIIPILVILFIGSALIIWDGRKILDVLRHADWQVIPGALFFTALSYFCVGFTYAMLARMWGIRMPRRALTEIAIVTTSLNHVVRSGGIAGFSVRYMLMSQYKVTFNDVISSSLVHFYLTSLDMLVMLPVALAYVLLNTSLPRSISTLLSVITMIFVFLAVIGSVLIFSNKLRLVAIDFLRRLGNSLTRHDFSNQLHDFNLRMTHGVGVLKNDLPRFAGLMLLTFVDWTSSVIVLSLCFDAFGPPLNPGAVIASFMIGIMAGVISALPGGIGIQEGSMTGVSLLLGATFVQAILAALLFRVIYYIIPYAISPIFYWRLLRQRVPDPG